MRVLHCIPSMSEGGGERQLAYLAAGLIQMGWEVHVALLSGGPNLDRLQASGAVIHKVSCTNNYDPGITWQLRRLLHTIRPVLTQTWFRQMDILGGVLSLMSGVPWILSERASALAYPHTLKSCVRALMARKASAIISNSACGRMYWQKQIAADRVPQYVIPNAVPAEEIERSTPACLSALGVEPQQKVILYAGRFDAQKNLDNLLTALRQVIDQTRAVAVLCGDGPLRLGVAHHIQEHGLAGRVLLPGYVSALWSWMKRADVFVSVSLFEGRPNTVLEAMACGLPLVVSDIPEHREFLDEYSALLVNPYAPAAIAAAIVSVLAAPEAAACRAQTARAQTVQWSIPTIAHRYAQVYHEVLARRAHPGPIQDRVV